jgi:hypothetical protein
MASRRVNAAVLVAMLAYFLLRVRDVGLVEALAEVLGLSELHAYYANVYWPLQPALFRSQPTAFWLDPQLAAALALPNATLRSEALGSLARHHGHGVFTLPLLNDAAARVLAREVDHFVASGHVSAQPNSMNEYGVVLGADGLDGLDGLLRLLTVEVLSPLAAAFYDEHGMLADGTTAHGDALDGDVPDGRAAARAALAVDARSCCAAQHAFVVRYNATEQRGLDMHHDASEVRCLDLT